VLNRPRDWGNLEEKKPYRRESFNKSYCNFSKAKRRRCGLQGKKLTRKLTNCNQEGT